MNGRDFFALLVIGVVLWWFAFCDVLFPEMSVGFSSGQAQCSAYARTPSPSGRLAGDPLCSRKMRRRATSGTGHPGPGRNDRRGVLSCCSDFP